MKHRIIEYFAIAAVALFAWSCQDQQDIGSADDLVLISEISDDNAAILEKKAETNWIPGDLFPNVSADYLVFSQSAYMPRYGSPDYFQMTMVPYAFRNNTGGAAAENSYEIFLPLKKLSFKQDDGVYSMSVKNASVPVKFVSMKGCVADENTIQAKVTLTGIFAEVGETGTGKGLLLNGFGSMALKLSGGAEINLLFKELYLQGLV